MVGCEMKELERRSFSVVLRELGGAIPGTHFNSSREGEPRLSGPQTAPGRASAVGPSFEFSIHNPPQILTS